MRRSDCDADGWKRCKTKSIFSFVFSSVLGRMEGGSRGRRPLPCSKNKEFVLTPHGNRGNLRGISEEPIKESVSWQAQGMVLRSADFVARGGVGGVSHFALEKNNFLARVEAYLTENCPPTFHFWRPVFGVASRSTPLPPQFHPTRPHSSPAPLPSHPSTHSHPSPAPRPLAPHCRLPPQSSPTLAPVSLQHSCPTM